MRIGRKKRERLCINWRLRVSWLPSFAHKHTCLLWEQNKTTTNLIRIEFSPWNSLSFEWGKLTVKIVFIDSHYIRSPHNANFFSFMQKREISPPHTHSCVVYCLSHSVHSFRWKRKVSHDQFIISLRKSFSLNTKHQFD